MKIKDLKINFRYLGGNIACLSVDSIAGESIHNDIDNEEAIIIFNSLVGEKENCQIVKTLLKENQELKKQLENCEKFKNELLIRNAGLMYNEKQFIKYLEDEIKLYENDIQNFKKDYKVYFSLINDLRVSKAKIEEILQKYKEIIGVSDEPKS